MYTTTILLFLVAIVDARFGQEQGNGAIQAINDLGDLGKPGEAGTISGGSIGLLLAAANPCKKLEQGDKIIETFGDSEKAVAAARGLVAAETNFNPFAASVPNVCGDPALPKTEALRGVVPLVDPAVIGQDVENKMSAQSLKTPFDAKGLSQAEVMVAQGFSNFTAVMPDGTKVNATSLGGAKTSNKTNTKSDGKQDDDDTEDDDKKGKNDSGSSASSTGSKDDKSSSSDSSSSNSGSSGASSTGSKDDKSSSSDSSSSNSSSSNSGSSNSGSSGASSTGGKDDKSSSSNSVGSSDNTSNDKNSSGSSNTASGENSSNKDSASASGSAQSAGNSQSVNDPVTGTFGGFKASSIKGLDFGKCVPTMKFEAGLNGRKETEMTFQAIDPQVNKGQSEALNPNIITNRIKDQLSNVCGANQAAKDAAVAAMAKVSSLGTKDASVAKTWNTALGFDGVDINPDKSPKAGLVGHT